ncbi:histone-like protein 18C [Drosophila eugracilis]|uniref:histone-like protein 18C n=1 Tax=Drosophila eugracilis TaxID=29029 RepID=UPI0007E64922|nr:histone-like protein 18C [Drosophila eugracilis]
MSNLKIKDCEDAKKSAPVKESSEGSLSSLKSEDLLAFNEFLAGFDASGYDNFLNTYRNRFSEMYTDEQITKVAENRWKEMPYSLRRQFCENPTEAEKVENDLTDLSSMTASEEVNLNLHTDIAVDNIFGTMGRAGPDDTCCPKKSKPKCSKPRARKSCAKPKAKVSKRKRSCAKPKPKCPRQCPKPKKRMQCAKPKTSKPERCPKPKPSYPPM